jgi:uncharacterized protein
MTARIDAYLVAAGKYHDFDFARLELLKLLAEHPHVRVRVAADYEDIDEIAKCQFLISYTCDVRPSLPAQAAIRAWVQDGGRWLALHGTNSALERTPPTWSSPRNCPIWADTLGSQFLAHPPIAPYRVVMSDTDHWLVQGIEPFDTDDELYLSDYPARDQLQPLLQTHWNGTAAGFTDSDWIDCSDEHLVMYLRPLGDGSVLYNTLGHCRGHWDMTSAGVQYYPTIQRGSWTQPQYYELLRRSIRWAMGAAAEPTLTT